MLDARVCYAGRDHQGVVMVQIFIFGLEGDLKVTICLGSLLHLCLGVIALLSVMTVVMVEAVVTSAITLLRSSLHRVGGFEESFLLDLEEDLSPG
ncbi:hypothetical protein BHE74_00043555 [Ensete ventricosum]|nr:hypothetical protein BHE74_00043555 [Ensete ventricosum]